MSRPMAQADVMRARLERWAAWLDVGDSAGFPNMSVLHPDWSPPSPGTRPSMKVASHTDVRATHRAVGRLSMRLSNTLVVHYCLKLPIAQQAERLQCAERTVYERLDRAHRQLQAEFCNKREEG